MMSMKRYLLLIILFAAAMTGITQNDPQFSLWEYNRLLFNPAATGQSKYVDIHLMAQEQWAGFEEAPSTQSFSISNYFGKYRMAGGLTFINDQLGAERMQNIKAKYAYHVRLGANQYISFGLGAGVMVKSLSSSELTFEESDDPHATDADYNETKLDFDFGMELHLSGFFIGAAVNHITQQYDDYDITRIPRHQYGYVGYRFDSSPQLSFIPRFSISNIDEINVYEASLTASYSDKLWLGIGYRLDDSMILSTKISLTENILAAYSYDMSAGDLQNYRNGSHEVMLHLRINKPEKRYQSPRFF